MGAIVTLFLAMILLVLMAYSVASSAKHLTEVEAEVPRWQPCEVAKGSLVDHCYQLHYTSAELFAASLNAQQNGQPEARLLMDIALAKEIEERLVHEHREQLFQRRPVRAIKRLRGAGA